MTSVAAPQEHAPLRRPLAPGVLVRAEGAVLLVAATVAYGRLDASWWLFAALFLAPDLSMLAYLGGARVGAAGYNLAHTLCLPLALAAAGLAADSTTALAVALVWAAHIGMDRALGFGLKYATGFRDTHLQRLGGA